jgi:putative phosphonate metabolism protein
MPLSRGPAYVRYAVFFAPPPDSRLWRLGSAWIGWDAEARAAPPPPADSPRERESWTAFPRRYGFHATLKAPFRLAEDAGPAELVARLRTFAASAARVDIGRLTLGRLGRFLALVPAAPSQALMGFAAACVEAFEDLQAPLSASELARREPEKLTERQRRLLLRWGYPYVMEEFRLHLTLTGPLPEAERVRARAWLEALFAPVLTEPYAIDALTLFGDPGGDRPFHLLERAPLLGGHGAGGAVATRQE